MGPLRSRQQDWIRYIRDSSGKRLGRKKEEEAGKDVVRTQGRSDTCEMRDGMKNCVEGASDHTIVLRESLEMGCPQAKISCWMSPALNGMG